MKLFKNWFKDKEVEIDPNKEKFKYYQNIFANLTSKELNVSRDEYNDIILSCIGAGSPPPAPIPDRNFYFPGTDILVIIDEEKTINEHRYKVLDDILKNDQVEI